MNYKLTAFLLIIGMLVITSEVRAYRRTYDYYRHHYDYYPVHYDADDGLESIIADVLNKLFANHGTEE